jgi:hypothetical protein
MRIPPRICSKIKRTEFNSRRAEAAEHNRDVLNHELPHRHGNHSEPDFAADLQSQSEANNSDSIAVCDLSGTVVPIYVFGSADIVREVGFDAEGAGYTWFVKFVSTTMWQFKAPLQRD